MMKPFFLFIVVLLFIKTTEAQQFTDSNLPIVIITTDIDPDSGDRMSIPDDPKVLADMKIIYRPDGSRNFITDQNNEDFLNYSGRIGIERRGSTSQSLDKKPYGLTTLEDDNESNNNVEILGMPKENDWVLNSLAYDQSLIRDYLSYGLARSAGEYAARGQYCEVIINGDYKGLYIFMEKLKIDSDRIDIVKLDDSDNDFPKITGGYITKADKTTGGDTEAWTYGTPRQDLVTFIHERPKPEDITQEQNDYIKSVFDNLLITSENQNSTIEDGYPSLIDIPSFVDFMLINEIASNVDAYQFSTFFHKDRGGKLRAGPVWDFNLTYGNDLFPFLDRSHVDVWQFDNGDNEGAKFWKSLFRDPVFNCYLSRRWSELTSVGQPLDYNRIVNEIDALNNLLSEARIREHQRWETITAFEEEISNLKSWLQQRITWMNNNIGGTADCIFPTVPNVVISRINYNPEDAGSVESDDLEFIALYNNSEVDIPVGGFYFRALGISYQFPAGIVMSPKETLFLASDSDAFEAYYEIKAIGEFTRNLSNKSQELLLTDAFGNEVDRVVYEDKAPWPDSDGTGSFLLLEDLNSDNSDPINWIAFNQSLGFDQLNSISSTTNIYPNPTKNELIIQNTLINIESVEVYDLLGRIMLRSDEISKLVALNTSALPNNTYILKVFLKDKSSLFKKIIKQ